MTDDKTMAKISDRVKTVVVDNLNVDETKVVPEASFTDDLGADSLDQVELVMALEDEFDIEIPDTESDEIRTVGGAIDYIQRKISPAA